MTKKVPPTWLECEDEQGNPTIDSTRVNRIIQGIRIVVFLCFLLVVFAQATDQLFLDQRLAMAKSLWMYMMWAFALGILVWAHFAMFVWKPRHRLPELHSFLQFLLDSRRNHDKTDHHDPR